MLNKTFFFAAFLLASVSAFAAEKTTARAAARITAIIWPHPDEDPAGYVNYSLRNYVGDAREPVQVVRNNNNLTFIY